MVSAASLGIALCSRSRGRAALPQEVGRLLWQPTNHRLEAWGDGDDPRSWALARPPQSWDKKRLNRRL